MQVSQVTSPLQGEKGKASVNSMKVKEHNQENKLNSSCKKTEYINIVQGSALYIKLTACFGKLLLQCLNSMKSMTCFRWTARGKSLTSHHWINKNSKDSCALKQYKKKYQASNIIWVFLYFYEDAESPETGSWWIYHLVPVNYFSCIFVFHFKNIN